MKRIVALKKHLLKLLAFSLVIGAIPFGVFGVMANAESDLSSETNIEALDKFASAAQFTRELSFEESAEVREVFANDFQNGVFEIHTDEESLDLENISILEVEQDGEEKFTSVTVSILEEDYNFLSNVTIVYDSNFDVVTYQESIIKKSEINTFEFVDYVEGQKIRQEVGDVEYVSNEELGFNKDDVLNDGVATQGLGAISICLGAILGVDGVIAYLIAGTCGAACASFVAVPVCVACIGAIATIGTANIAGIIACFSL